MQVGTLLNRHVQAAISSFSHGYDQHFGQRTDTLETIAHQPVESPRRSHPNDSRVVFVYFDNLITRKAVGHREVGKSSILQTADTIMRGKPDRAVVSGNNAEDNVS